MGHSGPCPVWPWISPRWILQLLWANLFLVMTLLWIKTKNLCSHGIFLYFSLCPLPLVLLLLTAESSQALPSFPIRCLYTQIRFPTEPFLLKAKQPLSNLGGLLLCSLQRVHVCTGGPEPGMALRRSCTCAEQRGRLTFLDSLLATVCLTQPGCSCCKDSLLSHGQLAPQDPQVLFCQAAFQPV